MNRPGDTQNPSVENLVGLKGLSHEIFRPVFWPVWIYLGLNGNRFSFLNFKEGSLILDSCFKYWCVSCQTFSEIRRISEKDWQLSLRFSNFSLFWVSGPRRNAAKGVNTSRRFVEFPRMIDNLFRGSPRMFYNNISVSLIRCQSSRRFVESPRRIDNWVRGSPIFPYSG
jgi:hypothetical protein